MSSTDPSQPGATTDAPVADEKTPYVPTGADYVSDRQFVDFPISPEVLRAVHEMGYRTATPVQAATIEPAIAGKDMLVRAKTGTGKTVAFSIPIIERIEDGTREPRAIILAPTRELAMQTADECTALAKYRDISVALLVGGVPMGSQERALADGAAIIVGTPGRVLDHLRRRNLVLANAVVGCLDEADEMLSMGFYEDVTAILDAMPKSAQYLLLSATMSPATEKIVAKYLKEPLQILMSTDADQVEGIEHVLYETPTGQHKVRSLLYLLDLEDPTSAIIFTNTREDAATVASFLDRQGLDVQLLSGELPQTRRNKVMRQVKRGEVRFLVATDVAARGIDSSDLSHVIQYSLPQDPSIYLHRTGRTGRIGKKGTAISLVGGPDLQTKKVLEGQHHIKFVTKTFPTPDECVNRRVERQATQIRDAMGTMVFESYLPTVKALLARPDGEGLLAASLRAFFQWDRTRRAAIADAADAEANGGGETDGEPVNLASTVGRPERKPRVDRDRPPPRERERERRPERGERREARDPRDDRRDARPPPPRRRQETAPVDEDLDALLLDEGDAPMVTPVLADATSAVAPDEASDVAKKKRRRRRKKGKKAEGDTASADGADGDSADDEDTDEIVVDGGEAPSEAVMESPIEDLDALLSME